MEYIVTGAVVALLVAAVFYVPWLRSRERRRLLEALMQASEKGHVPPAELLQPLLAAVTGGSPTSQSARDTRRGVFYLGTALMIVALALAEYAFCLAAGIPEGTPAAFCIAFLGLIPAFIGGGYLMVARLARKSNGGSAG